MQKEEKREKGIEIETEGQKAGGDKKIVYIRKLTSEETTEKFIVVLRTDLDKFPATGQPFTLRAGEQNYRVAIREIPSSGNGPHKTKHIISAPKLFVTQKFKLGDKIVISKKAEKIYNLKVI
ncbi:MAG: hypothetical protein Kow0090_21450 [Myxococcota bacterium]